MRLTTITAAITTVVLANTAMAGDPLLAPGATLTYQVTQSSRSPQTRAIERSTTESTCTLAAIAGGPTSFEALELRCDSQWRCGELRSDLALAYTSSGLQTFSTPPSAQTTAAQGTTLQAGPLEHGAPFSLGGQTGFVQCQTAAVTPGSRAGTPNAPRPPQNRPPREVTTCSAYEVGFTSVEAPLCSAQLSAVVPAQGAVAQSATPPAAAPAAAPEATPPSGSPSLTFDAGEQGQELNLLVGESRTVLNPIDMMAMNELYCWASSTPALNGVQAFVTYADLPANSTIEATLMGSTAMFEDEYGYMSCDESQMKLLGGASISASGASTQTVAIPTSQPMPSWPCALEVSAVVMKGAGDMVEPVLEAKPVSTWITCPE